jgi:hypothetical protein
VRSVCHTTGKTTVRSSYDDSMKTGVWDRLKDHLGAVFFVL